MTLPNKLMSPVEKLLDKLTLSIKLVERSSISFGDMENEMSHINNQLKVYISDLESIKIKYHIDKAYFSAVKEYIDKVKYVCSKVSVFSTENSMEEVFNDYNIIRAFLFKLEKQQQALSKYILEVKNATSETSPQNNSIYTEFISRFGKELCRKNDIAILFKFINFAVDPFYRVNPFNMANNNSDIWDIFVEIRDILGEKPENDVYYYFNVLFEVEIIEICQIILANNKDNVKKLVDYQYSSNQNETNQRDYGEGETPLHLAARHNLPLLASWLLKNNCDIKIYSAMGDLAYFTAIVFGHTEIALQIIETAAIRKLSEDYFTTLLISTWLCFVENSLLDRNTSTSSALSLLSSDADVRWESILPYVQILSRLLLEGADLNADINKYLQNNIDKNNWKDKKFFDFVSTENRKIMMATSVIFCLYQLQPSNEKSNDFMFLHKFQFADNKFAREIAKNLRAKKIILDILYNDYTFFDQYVIQKKHAFIHNYFYWLAHSQQNDIFGMIVRVSEYQSVSKVSEKWFSSVLNHASSELPLLIADYLQAAKDLASKKKICKLLYQDSKLKDITMEILKTNQKFKWVLDIWDDFVNHIDSENEDSSGDETPSEGSDNNNNLSDNDGSPTYGINDLYLLRIDNGEDEGETHDGENGFGL